MPTSRRARDARRRAAASWAVALLVTGAVVVAGVVALRGAATDPLVTERCTATVDGSAYELEPDQAANAALITAVSVSRGLPARAATIAVATAVQESGLRNLSYGDRDSLGLFQQRPSQGWGTEQQVQDPVYASNAFYDALVAVEGYEAMEVTVASDLVQRSAFPDAVADHEPEGRAYASTLTGFSPAALVCRLRGVDGAATESAGESGLTPRADQVVSTATAEFGPVSSVAAPPLSQVEGTAVAVSAAGAEPDRLAWAVGHWAVASADRLDVVAVTVGDRVWRREDVDAGWQVTDAPAPAGTAVVEVASG